jgi:hypothetical protein
MNQKLWGKTRIVMPNQLYSDRRRPKTYRFAKGHDPEYTKVLLEIQVSTDCGWKDVQDKKIWEQKDFSNRVKLKQRVGAAIF